MWKCGGGNDLGRHCAGHGTFWNIRGGKPQSHPGEFGPASMNLVAVVTRDPSVTDPAGIWFEAISPELIEPADLHAAQLSRRLKAH
jgi:hypothetical protein